MLNQDADYMATVVKFVRGFDVDVLTGEDLDEGCVIREAKT